MVFLYSRATGREIAMSPWKIYARCPRKFRLSRNVVFRKRALATRKSPCKIHPGENITRSGWTSVPRRIVLSRAIESKSCLARLSTRGTRTLRFSNSSVDSPLKYKVEILKRNFNLIFQICYFFFSLFHYIYKVIIRIWYDSISSVVKNINFHSFLYIVIAMYRSRIKYLHQV